MTGERVGTAEDSEAVNPNSKADGFSAA